MKQWMYRRHGVDLQQIADRYNISTIIAEVLLKRGLYTWEAIDRYLYPKEERMHDPALLHHSEQAVAILKEKIEHGCKIGVIGDYDVDGIMSTYILVRSLQLLDAEVVWRLPHRVHDGYGIRDYMVEEAYQDGVDTILTCDNGISAMAAVVRAKELGMTLILTDHHEIPTEQGKAVLPPADCIIDPKQPDCTYPWKEICGAGVAYKLMELLYRSFGKIIPEDMMIYAGIATVCDVMPLQDENRIMVSEALKRLKQCDNTGLNELIQAQGLQRQINAGDFGFRIGPCLNAAGRLEDASIGLRLLLEQDMDRARQMAQELVSLNEERKQITKDATDCAVNQVEQLELSQTPILLLYLEACPECVAGIVAGRIRERYYRPTMILSRSGMQLKGSGRSIPGYHMQKELTKCADLLVEYGGHAMAAGFSLEEAKLEELRARLLFHCTLTDEDFVEKVSFDAEVPLGQVNYDLIQQLQMLQPIGQGNENALFAKRKIAVKSVRVFGKENQIGRFQVRDEGRNYTLIDFNIERCCKRAIVEKYGEAAWNALSSGGREELLIDILYLPEINQKYGDIQYRVIDAR